MPTDTSAVTTGIAATGGALSAGALLAWWLKALMARMIQQYDKKHDESDRRYGDLVASVNLELRNVGSKLAAVEVRAAEVTGMRERQDKLAETVAVQGATILKLQRDLGVAHERLRAISGAKKI